VLQELTNDERERYTESDTKFKKDETITHSDHDSESEH
jgi:hypothetical protein